MAPDWEEAIEGCLGYLATEKSHSPNSQLINRLALDANVKLARFHTESYLPRQLRGLGGGELDGHRRGRGHSRYGRGGTDLLHLRNRRPRRHRY